MADLSSVIKKTKKKHSSSFEDIKGPKTPTIDIEMIKGPKYEPMDLEKVKGPKMVPLDMEGLKGPKFKPGIPSQKSKETDVEIEIMLNSAKKKNDVNATSSEGEHFKVEKDSKGKWAETGAEKERYLKALGKLGKKKGK